MHPDDACLVLEILNCLLEAFAHQGKPMSASKDVGDLQEVRVPWIAEHFAGSLLLRCQDVDCDDKQEVQHDLSLSCQIGCKLFGSCT